MNLRLARIAHQRCVQLEAKIDPTLFAGIRDESTANLVGEMYRRKTETRDKVLTPVLAAGTAGIAGHAVYKDYKNFPRRQALRASTPGLDRANLAEAAGAHATAEAARQSAATAGEGAAQAARASGVGGYLKTRGGEILSKSKPVTEDLLAKARKLVRR